MACRGKEREDNRRETGALYCFPPEAFCLLVTPEDPRRFTVIPYLRHSLDRSPIRTGTMDSNQAACL
jgi:hypothetical protein